MSLEHSPARQRVRPRFGRIPQALAYRAVSRSRFYEWAREHPELVMMQSHQVMMCLQLGSWYSISTCSLGLALKLRAPDLWGKPTMRRFYTLR